jgi:hypothetical protein
MNNLRCTSYGEPEAIIYVAIFACGKAMVMIISIAENCIPKNVNSLEVSTN